MSAASIILLLLVAFIASKLFRSTRMWWILMSIIMAGLLVGMLSKEVINHSKKNDVTSLTQVSSINNDNLNTDNCTLFIDNVTESISCSRTMSYSYQYLMSFIDITDQTLPNNKASPLIFDDS